MRADYSTHRLRAVAAWSPGTLALAAFASFAAWVIAAAPQVGHFSDSVEYLVMADFFSGHYLGNPTEHSTQHFGQTRFPPLYPMTLALAGAGTTEQTRALAITLLQAMFALLAVAWWLRHTTKRPLAAGLLLVPLALAPGWLLLLLEPVSEPLFMLILFASLACAELMRERRVSPWVFCALAATLPLARSAGIVLCVVALPWLWLLGERRVRFVAMAALLLLPAAAWSAYRRLLTIQFDYSAQLTLGSILDAFGGWDGWLLGQWPRLGSALVEALHPDRTTLTVAIALALLLPAAVGFVARASDRRLDAWFLAGYLGLVFVWPYPAEQARLLLVVLPIFAICATTGLAHIARHWAGRGDVRVAAAVVALALALPVFAFCVRVSHRIALSVDPELAAHKATPQYLAVAGDEDALTVLEIRERLLATLRELPETIPRDECVYTVLPALTWIVARGRVDVELMPAGIDSEAQARARLTSCRYVLVAWVTTPQHREQAMYPYRWVAPATRPVLLSRMGERTVVALLERTDAR